MPIFRRDSEPDGTSEPRSTERSARTAAGTEPRFTRIAAGNEMVGEITGSTDVEIEGDLQGEVRITGTVRVGPEGRVRGGLDARVLEIAGKVRGDVVGREIITLDRSAELFGNLSAPRVVIHEGAFFKGQVEMTGESDKGGASKADASKGDAPKRDAPKRDDTGPKTGPKEAPNTVPKATPDDGREQGGEG